MNKLNNVLTRGVEKIYPNKQALKKTLSGKKKIKLYQGFDPSMPNLHLGHLVGLIKLKQFQDLGHQVIFLIGDFTGMIGDPTNKKATRQRLSRQQVLANAKNWQKQAGKILSFSGKNPAQIKFNSKWNDRYTFKDIIKITANFTVQQMLERDFFQQRLKEQKPIYLHEFLYPVAQSIDCVEMEVDLEIGGSDQTFNMLTGRNLMKALKQKEKYVLATKLLIDGRGEKAGKTSGNALFLNTPPDQMYGAVMAFSDEIVPLAFELLTQVSLSEIKTLKQKLEPMIFKKRLALEVVSLVHSPQEAEKAQVEFERVFQAGRLPKKVPVFNLNQKTISLLELLKKTNLITSGSEAKRLIRQGAVEMNQRKTKDLEEIISLKRPIILRIGKKKFIKVK